MTLQQLKYIVALDTYRHFVKAAESCFVSQPTLTLQVKKLEEEVGLAIFDRSSQPLVPTPMGEKIISKARYILRETQGLKDMVNERKNELEGTFRLGIIPTLAPYLLPLFVKEFSDAHPQIQLEIREINSEDLIESLRQGILDLGILATPISEASIKEYPLFYEPFLIYAHKNHPLLEMESLQAAELEEEGLWLLDKGHCFRNQVLNICDKSDLLCTINRLSFESGSIETLKNMIRSHSGYTLIPELAVNETMDTPFVKRFLEPQPAREISLVTHINFDRELLLNKLRQSITQSVPSPMRMESSYMTIDWK
ncbi:MAG: LysR substrate-binding domain-containing protein [Bacteroidota bacterium]